MAINAKMIAEFTLKMRTPTSRLGHAQLASRVQLASRMATRCPARAGRVGRRTLSVKAAVALETADSDASDSGFIFSGLKGQAIESALLPSWPEKREILGVIPEHCFKKDTVKSMMYAAVSLALTVVPGVLAHLYLPYQASYLAAWAAYALWTGTAATGCWVVAHECGHGAFSDNKTLQDTVGYVLHTLLLVPYFSWQRSHAVHHSRTNHVTEGETHVPAMSDEPESKFTFKVREAIGGGPFAVIHTLAVLAFGWPVYLLTGASGGPVRGNTNHFLPNAGAKGKYALFPGGWKNKVYLSDIGIAGALGGIGYLAYTFGVLPVLALYGAPLMVTNAWLVLYTWLQHTGEDVPHLGEETWTWEKGAFMTIDRPYGALADFLHHRIGSTHVAHHLNHQIPHYHAKEATEAIKAAFPQHYLYDPTPIWKATWNVAKNCIAVEKNKDNLWVFKTSVA
eukprot:CAMPEP_0196579266 /NCGR_PEP_ID=MMETSP1081-20130531/19816_1 /TAXON_ID=36882 /ORGANISM="Pyramimonas amylifera, Strain CCMP720" /LENGTH=451 /DNA_ID=CAMNT_0041898785 /DNA_START=101 /DNA_END=1456 /DNA_ORIENTATION=-